MRLAALVSAGFLAYGVALVASAAPAPNAAEAPIAREVAEFFEKNVRPVLAEKCYSCHGSKNQFASLRVDSRAALLKGSDKGAILVPGDPDKSRLIAAINHVGGLKMPPTGKLPDKVLADFATWVKMGAPWPGAEAAPSELTFEQRIVEARKTLWSLQPVRKPFPPKVADKTWAKSAVDRFVQAKLEAKGLRPSKPADRRTLIRRVSFDLTGLPPTPEEVDAFVADKSPDAYEKVVDRLLASPQYGERWGRQWLDVARYSDTLGYLVGNVGDAARQFPFAYTYRDYVVRALNEDKPYNQFIVEQIAADQVPLKDKRDLAALGFITVGNRYLGNTQEIIDDRIDVVTRGLQGMTVQCARCHDHKFDPIPTADYYSLYGVFAATREPGDLPQIGEASDPKAAQEFAAKHAELTQREAELRAAKKDGDAGNVRNQIQQLVATHAGAPPRAMVLNDVPNPGKPRILLRGNPGTPGPEVPRQYLIAVQGEKRQPFSKGSGRLELAQQIASPENPLTARVMVNRIWLGHFGKGLVATPSDYGTRGELPTHPELLDWLSTYFMENGWSMKKLHRLLVTSATYQQSSEINPAAIKADPENSLLWRYNRRRLDFEQLRDSMLRATGMLDTTLYGRAVDIVKNVGSGRRTLYGYIDRQDLYAVYRTFDFADPGQHAAQRPTTTVPQQALYLMNSAFAQRQARDLLQEASVAGAKTDEARVRALYRRLLGRQPAADEVKLALDFIQRASGPAAAPEVEAQAWSYGFGAYDAMARKLKSFTAMPHFTGQAWQGGAQLPDPKIGWATLNANGGHTGDAQHAAIRRWTAPRDMTITLSGTVRHLSDKGDGVEALIVSNRAGLLGSWVAFNGSAETTAAQIPVKRGETIDFVASCRKEVSFDSFNWTPRVQIVAQTGVANSGASTWDAASDFAGPGVEAAKGLSPWEAYAQALFMTNEFMFID